MNNLGKASVKVELLQSAPNVSKKVLKYGFDATAAGWDQLQNSAYFRPFFMENVALNDGTLSVCFPVRRKYYFNNLMTLKGRSTVNASATPPYIFFTESMAREGVVDEIIREGGYNEYSAIRSKWDSSSIPTSYKGPIWEDNPHNNQAPPSDWITIKSFVQSLVGEKVEVPPISYGGEDLTDKDTSGLWWLEQDVVEDGLWWMVESEPFLTINMPFWTTIRKLENPPKRVNNEQAHATMFVISLGIGNSDNGAGSIDICISENARPRIIHYINGGRKYFTMNNSQYASEQKIPRIEAEFEYDLSKLWEDDNKIEVGVMTVAGRLVIFFNKTYFIYTAVQNKNENEKQGTIREVVIPSGAIRIFGTNIKAAINVSPMTFAPRGIMALGIQRLPKNLGSVKTTSGKEVRAEYSGVDNKGETNGSVCLVPNEANGTAFGVDCKDFIGPATGSKGMGDSKTEISHPTGFGFHRQGVIYFNSAEALSVTKSDGDFYILIMKPEHTYITLKRGENDYTYTTYTVPYGGTPYYFRLKGGYDDSPEEGAPIGEDVTKDVISVEHSFDLDDYFMISANASVALYNKNGKYDYLKTQQYPITISFGWNNTNIKKFTGLVVSTTNSEVPGKEIITLECQDYMFVLRNTPIVNSPYFDGMILFYAAKYLAQMAGIGNIYQDWENTDEYFLPSGYAFTKPRFKYPSTQMIYECIKDVVQRGEATAYFDSDGDFHVKKLPGGLFSEEASQSVKATFFRNPDNDEVAAIVLDEKNEEYSLRDTVNTVSIISVEKNDRNYIFYNTQAIGDEDRLQYRRILMIDEGALGDVESVTAWAEDLKKRVFYPIRKISFKTTGFISNNIQPLDFVTVDNNEYRVIGIRNSYMAESNDFNCEYTCEWLGGA